MKKFLYILSIVMVFGFSTLAHATLVDNGGGLIYDTDLNITWYDYTYKGFYRPLYNPITGAFVGNYYTATWDEAMSWASNLSVGGATDWRLPHVLPVNGSSYFWSYPMRYEGVSDIGYNISAPGTVYAGSKGSEMPYLYYYELGNKGMYDTSGNLQSGYGFVNKGPFKNVNGLGQYWSGTDDIPWNSTHAFAFGLYAGNQGSSVKNNWVVYALAVHEGNVGVPEPATILLLGLGLVGIAGMRRKMQR